MSELTEPTDAELVAGVLAGDREAFAAVYDRYADRLHDFCAAVLRDREEAADAVQDTFVLLAQRLAQLNDPDRLRPWLYSVARSVALRKVRTRRRVVFDEVGDMVDTDPGPDRAAEQVALRELVWSAAAGLSERDRALLDLHVRQGLDGAELGEAMGVSTNHAYVLLTRLRDQVERSLGAFLIARQGRRDCAGLDTLLSDWDGRYSPLMRKRVARHVDSCEVCTNRRRIMVSPFALLATVPVLTAPVWLRDRVLADVQLAAYQPPAAGPAAGPVAAAPPGAGPDPESEPRSESDPPALAARKRLQVLAAAAAVLVLLIVGAMAVYLRDTPVPGEPLGLDTPIGRTTSPAGSSSASPTPSSTPPPTTTTTTVAVAPVTDDPTTTEPPMVEDPPDPPDPDPPDTESPVIGRPSANDFNAQNCLLIGPYDTEVSAPVTDNVGVASVVLSWVAPDESSGSTPMTLVDGAWRATLGPFPTGGVVPWRITATDAAGNPATIDNKTNVTGCSIE